MSGAETTEHRVKNIEGKPQYGTSSLASDPATSALTYTVNQLLGGRTSGAPSTSGMELIEVVALEWNRVLTVHRAALSTATAPMLPPAGPLPDFEALVEEDLARRGIQSGRLRGVKVEDREISETAAAVRLDTMRVDAEYARLSQQSMLDDVWERLLSNEPSVVAGVLGIAFRGNELAARALEVTGNCVVLELIAPSLDRAIPSKKPGTNRKGAPSVVRATAADRHDAYRQYVLGAALLAAREVVAVAPSIDFVDVSVLTLESKAAAAAGGAPKGVARFFVTRSSVSNVNVSLPADELVLSCAHASRIALGRRGGLKPIGLEYDKTDKQIITALLDPDRDDPSVVQRIGRATSEAVSKSGEFGSKQLKRVGDTSSAAAQTVRRRVSRKNDDD
ncbi:MAG: hypothetical protein ACN4GZ_10400 [Acidimicrobiales bacterium]